MVVTIERKSSSPSHRIRPIRPLTISSSLRSRFLELSCRTAGCYFSPHLLAPWRDSPYIDPAVLARYEPVGGVRLEDVVVVEEGGVRNLTWVVREREEVEGLCSGKA
jgi:Xaa-Pro aminopeptidase